MKVFILGRIILYVLFSLFDLTTLEELGEGLRITRIITKVPICDDDMSNTLMYTTKTQWWGHFTSPCHVIF